MNHKRFVNLNVIDPTAHRVQTVSVQICPSTDFVALRISTNISEISTKCIMFSMDQPQDHRPPVQTTNDEPPKNSSIREKERKKARLAEREVRAAATSYRTP